MVPSSSPSSPLVPPSSPLSPLAPSSSPSSPLVPSSSVLPEHPLASVPPERPRESAPPEHFHIPTIMSGVVHVMPAHVTPATPEPAYVTPYTPEPAHVTPSTPEPAHITQSTPEPAHVMPSTPEPASPWPPALPALSWPPESSSVTNPAHGLPLTHHQRSPAHHMDSCTTLTVALHLRLQFPSPIALTIHALNTADYTEHTAYLSHGLPLCHGRVLFSILQMLATYQVFPCFVLVSV